MIQEKKTKGNKPKKLIVCLCGLVIIFLVVNLLWVGCVKMRYGGYAKDMKEITSPVKGLVTHEITRDGYTYKVAKPQYLQFDAGFLVVQDVDQLRVYLDDEGNIAGTGELEYIILYIWPKVFTETEYGYVFMSDNGQTLAEIMTDSELNLLKPDEETAEEKQMATDNHARMSALMQHAMEYWELQ